VNVAKIEQVCDTSAPILFVSVSCFLDRYLVDGCAFIIPRYDWDAFLETWSYFGDNFSIGLHITPIMGGPGVA
jgi:hypothetical protein